MGSMYHSRVMLVADEASFVQGSEGTSFNATGPYGH